MKIMAELLRDDLYRIVVDIEMMPDVEGQQKENLVGFCVVKVVPVNFPALHLFVTIEYFLQIIRSEIFLNDL